MIEVFQIKPNQVQVFPFASEEEILSLSAKGSLPLEAYISLPDHPQWQPLQRETLWTLLKQSEQYVLKLELLSAVTTIDGLEFQEPKVGIRVSKKPEPQPEQSVVSLLSQILETLKASPRT